MGWPIILVPKRMVSFDFALIIDVSILQLESMCNSFIDSMIFWTPWGRHDTFSFLDLDSGYWLVWVKPFGIGNAPAKFQCLMQVVLAHLEWWHLDCISFLWATPLSSPGCLNNCRRWDCVWNQESAFYFVRRCHTWAVWFHLLVYNQIQPKLRRCNHTLPLTLLWVLWSHQCYWQMVCSPRPEAKVKVIRAARREDLELVVLCDYEE